MRDGVWHGPWWSPLAFAAAAGLVILLVNLVASASSRPSAISSAMHSGSMMALPAYAMDMRVRISSPQSGTTLAGTSVTLQVAVSGFTGTCSFAGKPNRPGVGHYHVLLDKALINMFCTPVATISMQNVRPGMHTLAVVPALNDLTEVEANTTSITIDYEPT
jgi:hypothetical protein